MAKRKSEGDKKRERQIVADDGRLMVVVRIEITDKSGWLVDDELDKCAKDAVRGMVAGLSGISYSDFGVENVKLSDGK